MNLLLQHDEYSTLGRKEQMESLPRVAGLLILGGSDKVIAKWWVRPEICCLTVCLESVMPQEWMLRCFMLKSDNVVAPPDGEQIAKWFLLRWIFFLLLLLFFSSCFSFFCFSKRNFTSVGEDEFQTIALKQELVHLLGPLLRTGKSLWSSEPGHPPALSDHLLLSTNSEARDLGASLVWPRHGLVGILSSPQPPSLL